MGRSIRFKEIETYIQSRIEAGEYQPGEQIPTEKQLQEQFGLSRMTVNKALSRLAELGYITRTAGKGSFVSSARRQLPAGEFLSFKQETELLGMKAETELLSYEVVPAGNQPAAADALRLKDTELIHHFVRLRKRNGLPVMVTDTCVPAKLLKAMDIGSLTESFHDHLRKQSVVFSRTEKTITARMPDGETAKLLGSEGGPVLRISQLIFILTGHGHLPFEYSVSDCSGSRYSLAVTETFH